MPRVSVGLPVFNGENYLSEAVRSILGQSFRDLELIICDDASADATEAIGRAFARRDPRVRYFRNPANLGAARNFNRCVDLSTGAYFKWAAHDDLCLPGYLRLCVDVLDRDPGVVLCQTGIRWIDADGTPLFEYRAELNKLAASDRIDRFANEIDGRHACLTVFGLMRRDALLRTSRIASYTGSDRDLLAQLALQGRIVHVPSVQLVSRDHAARSVRAIGLRDRGAWFDTAKPPSGRFHYVRLANEHVRALFRLPLPKRDRIRGLLRVAAWIWTIRVSLLRELFWPLRPVKRHWLVRRVTARRRGTPARAYE